MSNVQVQELEKLTEDNISQSKYILSSALIEALRDRDPEDVKALKETVFWILEQNDDIFEPAKYSIIDGRILDAADQMVLLAERAKEAGDRPIDKCGDLFFKAGILYRPFVAFKALSCFENALEANAGSKACHAELARLYKRLGDVTRFSKHDRLASGGTARTVPSAGFSVENERANHPYASNVTLLPITIVRDDKQKFSQNLDLE